MLGPIFILLGLVLAVVSIKLDTSNQIDLDNELIWYHGRWDAGRGTWWAKSGFTLNVQNLSSLSLELGANTTQPSVAIGLSINYGPYISLNLTQGTNEIPLASTSSTDGATDSHSPKPGSTIVRLHTQAWAGNNMYLESIKLNRGAKLLRYKPSNLAFQFIGDSLSTEYPTNGGADWTWPFLTAEYFKAERNINAQPGACLTDQLCWGNPHGMTYLFFKTEDSGYYSNPNHNFTTNWDFRRDYTPTHVFVELTTNDNSYNITPASVTSTYVEFIAKLRKLYPHQPVFIVGAWGWPNSDGSVYYFYDGVFDDVVEKRRAAGDKNVYHIDTRGWVGLEDVVPNDGHPNSSGHVKVAKLMEAWLEQWGLQPQAHWPTQ